MLRKTASLLIALILLLCCIPSSFADGGDAKTVKILFTHDIHSFFIPSTDRSGDGTKTHGGAGRLKTLLDENRDENTIYVDGGDFSQGTLLSAGYLECAYELRLLGLLGCDFATIGNHEFDYGGFGLAEMLGNAVKKGGPLPKIVQSNINFDGELSEERKAVKDAFDSYGVSEYAVTEVGGVRVGLFGLTGIDSISCSPTSGMEYTDYIEAAKTTVDKMKDKCDIIVCLSHSGTKGDGKNGEDFDLTKEVEGIDVVISAHSHSQYDTPVMSNGAIVVSSGEYLSNLGSLTVSYENGEVSLKEYKLIPCDDKVKSDPETDETVEGFKEEIKENYLSDFGYDFDEVLCSNDINFMTLRDMYENSCEYPMGNLIADSYFYEAEKNGIDDIDVALVGLGTIRGSFPKGDITVSDAYNVCSLGVGSDNSAGHPILGCWVTGSEIKLLCELDISLGSLVSSIKMSYSGLKLTYNPNRVILDRVTDVVLTKDGKETPVEDDTLYRVSCNMYAANMLGMLNDLTKGVLKIVPKDKDGNEIENLYDYALIGKDGKEIKEWVAFCDYLSSFKDEGDGKIPSSYDVKTDRKEIFDSKKLTDILSHPGLTTILAEVLPFILIAIIILIVRRSKKRRRKKKMKKEKASVEE